MRKLTIEIDNAVPVGAQAVEIVERKGTGHPDYICDAAMERVSVALSREYIKNFGHVLHHNIDKGLLVAGTVEKGFGGGRVTKPMELIIGDRAVFTAGDTKVAVAEIAESTVRQWFRSNLKHVDADRHLDVRVVLQPGSAELTGIFERKGRVRGANDTSAAVGYAPLTPTERAVFDTERYINSPAFKLQFPSTGEDVKVMGIRTGTELDITIACPFISSMTGSEKEYFQQKGEVAASVRRFLAETSFSNVNVNFNTLDKKGGGVEGVYMTVTGTSAEDADSGAVGRGNRVNGVISLNRPMGTEAAAGKNPVSHVGKIYTVLAHRMAAEMFERIEGVEEVYVWLLSQIGAPVDSPKHVYVRIIPARKADADYQKKMAESIVEEFLGAIVAFTDELARGEYPVC